MMRSATLFALATWVGGALGEFWHLHRDPKYAPELGFGVALVGLAGFAALNGFLIFAYAGVSRAIRKEELRVRAYVSSVVLGLPFWFVVLPLHEFLRDRLGLPDALWWAEVALFCAASFEVIRFFERHQRRPPTTQRE